jgi:hypothetical protein
MCGQGRRRVREAPLRTNKEVTGFPREHDRFMGGVNPLIAERSGGLAQPVPGVSQIVGKISGESCLRRGPAVVVFFLDPLLAVVTLSTRHTQILTQSGEIPFSRIAVFRTSHDRSIGLELVHDPRKKSLSLMKDGSWNNCRMRYSNRSAATASVPAARRAGMKQATVPTTSRTAVTPAIVRRLVG